MKIVESRVDKESFLMGVDYGQPGKDLTSIVRMRLREDNSFEIDSTELFKTSYVMSRIIQETFLTLGRHKDLPKHVFDKVLENLLRLQKEKLINFIKEVEDIKEMIAPTKRVSRCCGRCDGVHDICVGDTICEDHNIMGCEKCFDPRG